MELSELQNEIVNSSENKIVVMAAAAAGKTLCLAERTRKYLRDGVNPSDIAVITFTNLAAQELRERLASDYKEGIYIGTIHGLANKFLVSHGIKTDHLIESEKFDDFFLLLKQNPYCIQHIPYILLDEAQDSSEDEFDFIFNMIQPDNFFIVGDTRQSIYSFRGADPSLLQNLVYESGVQFYDLNENYRNGDTILTYAKKILARAGMKDTSISMRDGGTVYEETSNLARIYEWIKSKGEYKDWAILCSTNDDVYAIENLLKKYDIPATTFKQRRMTKTQLDKILTANVVKVLTRHSAKGLEFPYVIVYNPNWWGGNEAKRVNYVAATRARDILVWMEPPKKKKRKYF